MIPIVRYLTTLILLTAILGSRPALAKKKHAWSQASRAISKLVAGDLVTAVKLLTQAKQLRADPQWSALVALVSLQGDRSADALKILNKIKDNGLNEPWIYYWSGRCAWAEKKSKLAFEKFSQAIGLGGAEPAQQMGLALMAIKQRKKKVALDALFEVAKRTPNLTQPSLYPSPTDGAIYLLPQILPKTATPAKVKRTQAHLLAQRGRVLQALALIGPLLKSHPRDAELFLLEAKLRTELGQRSLATRALDRALAIAPTSGPGLHLRGLRRLEAGLVKAAVADLKKAADRLPRDGQVLAQLGMACAKLGDLDCAEKYLGYATKQAPTLATVYFAQGELALKHGRHNDAAAMLAKALYLNSAEPNYYLAAAHLARLQNKPARAVRLLAAERRIRQLTEGHRRKIRTAAESERKMLAALDACGCGPGGCVTVEAGCLRSLDALAPALRFFFQAHLAIMAAKPQQARALLAKVRPKLRIEKLFSGSASELRLDFRDDKHTQIQVRKRLPMVPPWIFR